MFKRICIISLLSFYSFSSQAELLEDLTSKEKGISEQELDMNFLYQMDLVHDYIKNNPNCGQQEHIQVFDYDELANPSCINMGVNLLTVFKFDESIKSYMISDPANTGFFNVNVWIDKQSTIDNSFINKKSYTIKAGFPNKSANIIFLADSGREYYFDLKSIDFTSKEIPTKKVYTRLSEDLIKQVKARELEQVQQKEEFLIQEAKTLNYKDDNAYGNYMRRVHGVDINTSYKLLSKHKGEEIRPFAVYDNGKRTFFNFDGIIGTNSMPSISRVLTGVDIPLTLKEAYTISPSYKGWVYVDTISQEGFTLSLGTGKEAKVLCVKPTIDLRKFYNKQLEEPLIEVDFETGKRKATLEKQWGKDIVVLKEEPPKKSFFGKIKNLFKKKED